MSKKFIKIIVGANYGDEGKGLATHYFSQEAKYQGKKCLNILWSGGSQRGHTVEYKDSIRHVFRHFGSGWFDGADTYFGSEFVLDPIRFMYEYRKINTTNNSILVSPTCMVSTPYDTFINQIVEIMRGEEKHGSCGCGIWETYLRYDRHDPLTPMRSMNFGELYHCTDDQIMDYLDIIRSEYLPMRIHEYGYSLDDIDSDYKKLIASDDLLTNYISDLREVQKLCNISNQLDDLLDKYDTIIFEGSQGLALDGSNLDNYPYITAGPTGARLPIKYILNLAYDLDVEIVYVTRSYFTRHGVGPFPTECDREDIDATGSLSSYYDQTNIENGFQGCIRYGKFDYDELIDRVDKDIRNYKSIVNYYRLVQMHTHRSLFITHLNFNYDVLSNSKRMCKDFSKLYLSPSRYIENVIVVE